MHLGISRCNVAAFATPHRDTRERFCSVGLGRENDAAAIHLYIQVQQHPAEQAERSHRHFLSDRPRFAFGKFSV
jgi:hypothetical protein